VPGRDFWDGRRVWVTGHTGFKGAWLSLWLQQLGAEVHGFSHEAAEPSVYYDAAVGDGMAGEVRGDVRSRSELRAAVARAQPEVVFHLAAQALVRRGFERPVETFAINATGTAKVLEALRDHAEPAAVVVVTSDKCYRNDGSGTPFREDDPLGGDDPYSASKASQEHVAAAYRGLGLPVATGRAGNVLGGGDHAEGRLLADCMRAAETGEPLQVRAPEAVRPWQHVLGPVEGYLLIAERLLADPAGTRPAYNLGPDPEDARPVGWVVEQIRSRWPGGLPVRAAPPGSAAGEATVLRLDSSLAASALGWRPRWGLGAALDATVEWHVQRRDGADMRAETLRQLAAFAGSADGTVSA
jgi:CDP-glucose 4,6-dehydratase